jgi:hypothetical protein
MRVEMNSDNLNVPGNKVGITKKEKDEKELSEFV